MKTIRLADAKAHFSKLLATLHSGEEVTITRHGVAVAKLTGLAVSEISIGNDVVHRLRSRARNLATATISDADLVTLAHQGRR